MRDSAANCMNDERFTIGHCNKSEKHEPLCVRFYVIGANRERGKPSLIESGIVSVDGI
jgi:hypothetical protein